MRFAARAILLLLTVAALDQTVLAAAKKPHRSQPSSRHSSSGRPSSSRSSGRPTPRKRYEPEDDEDEEDDFGFADPYEEEDGFDEEEEEEEEDYRPKKKRSSSSRGPPSRGGSRPKSSRSSRYRDDDDYDRRGRPPPGGSRRSSRRGPPPPRRDSRGRMVPYGRDAGPSAFTKSLEILKNSIPDPSTVRDAAMGSLSVAREATSGLSTNLYREMKGLASSELEQVMLKATRPDDTAVKGKHVERLVGVTYQISARYDIYDAVMRKLWAKMAEKDWRTTIKALYILHRFSADGAPEHAAALKVSYERIA